jgi:hypothetical protein
VLAGASGEEVEFTNDSVLWNKAGDWYVDLKVSVVDVPFL